MKAGNDHAKVISSVESDWLKQGRSQSKVIIWENVLAELSSYMLQYFNVTVYTVTLKKYCNIKIEAHLSVTVKVRGSNSKWRAI